MSTKMAFLCSSSVARNFLEGFPFVINCRESSKQRTQGQLDIKSELLLAKITVEDARMVSSFLCQNI